MSEARSPKALEYLRKAERCAALAQQVEDSHLRSLYRQIVGQWQDMAEDAERLERLSRELETEMARLEAAQRRSDEPPT